MESALVVDRKISLKALKPSQAPSLFAVVDRNRSSLREFLPWLDFNTSVRDSENFILNASKSNLQGSTLILGLFSNNQIIGLVSFNEIKQQNRSAQIGYWLSEESRGQGIMSRAVQRLIDYGFESLGLNRIEIRAAPHNQRSCAIAERLGFKLEGLLRQVEWIYDHYHDLHVYSLLRSEWTQRRTQASPSGV